MIRFVKATATMLGLVATAAAGQPRGQFPAGLPGAPQAGPADLKQAVESGPRGTLAIRAVQGTTGAPAAGDCEVEIHLFHRDQPFKEIKTRLDEKGEALVGDIPVGMGVQPLVRIKYSGVTYQEIGPQMDAASSQASMDVVVYQTTDDTPAWHVASRQMMVDASGGQVRVSETVVAESPADKTWLGLPADAQGRRATVVVSLPQGATDVELVSGFHGWCCTSLAAGTLSIQMPLMPGKASYHLAYRVPVQSGRADLRIGAAAPTDHIVAFLPEGSGLVEPVLLAAAGDEMSDNRKIIRYEGRGVPVGQSAGLVLTGLTGPAPAAAVAGGGEPGGVGAIIIAAAVGLVVGGGAVLAARALRRPKPSV